MISRELAVSYRPIASLEPYAKNARTHSAEQVEQIADSIKEYGWTNPVLIDPEGGIIAGHGRVLAAHSLGHEEVPCIVLAGLNELQKRAYVIADNKLALNAGWNAALLALELQDLKAGGYQVFDPFGGSGTTMITAEKTNRRAFLLELDPHYADVIIKRWQEFTGRDAKHASGATFDDTARMPAYKTA